MGVRLNKVLTELNIGLQTAVDYLKNKKSLGEIKDDANMNTKINDEQYEALVKEFRGDKDVKAQAGMMFPTIIIPTAQEFAHISSSAVRDILKHHGDYSAFIPEGVEL